MTKCAGTPRASSIRMAAAAAMSACSARSSSVPERTAVAMRLSWRLPYDSRLELGVFPIAAAASRPKSGVTMLPAERYRSVVKADRIGSFRDKEMRRVPIDEECAQEATDPDQAIARDPGRKGRETVDPGRRGRCEDHRARAAAGKAVARDGSLFRQVRREAGLHPERAQGLRIRQCQARGLRRLPP